MRLGVELVGKDELFHRSDVVTVHLVLSDRTRGIVGERELAMMKPTALLINTARGPIVDEHALIHALRHSVIAGAGLDVFDEEPLPVDHPLRRLENAAADAASRLRHDRKLPPGAWRGGRRHPGVSRGKADQSH